MVDQVLLFAHPPLALEPHRVEVIHLYSVVSQQLIANLDLAGHSARSEHVGPAFALKIDYLGTTLVVDAILKVYATKTSLFVYLRIFKVERTEVI